MSPQNQSQGSSHVPNALEFIETQGGEKKVPKFANKLEYENWVLDLVRVRCPERSSEKINEDAECNFLKEIFSSAAVEVGKTRFNSQDDQELLQNVSKVDRDICAACFSVTRDQPTRKVHRSNQIGQEVLMGRLCRKGFIFSLAHKRAENVGRSADTSQKGAVERMIAQKVKEVSQANLDLALSFNQDSYQPPAKNWDQNRSNSLDTYHRNPGCKFRKEVVEKASPTSSRQTIFKNGRGDSVRRNIYTCALVLGGVTGFPNLKGYASYERCLHCKHFTSS